MEETRMFTFTGYAVLFLLCLVQVISPITGTREKSILVNLSSNVSNRTKRSTCGSDLFGDSGIIESPNYPNDYPSGAQCTWRIRTPERTRIILKFEAFETENNCDYDYLDIRDGYDSNSDRLEKLCGIDVPLSIESSGNKMILVFASDASVERKGFKAVFESVLDCGGEINSEEGDVTSPNYPDKYGKLQDCVWVIRVPPNYQISLRFRSFQLEYSAGCLADFVELRDGKGLLSPYLGKVCGTNFPDEILSSGSAMTVRFFSDDVHEERGFSAHFRKVQRATKTPKSMGVRNFPVVPMISTILLFILLLWI